MTLRTMIGVACFGALGVVARFVIGFYSGFYSGPFDSKATTTLGINILGSFLIGLAFVYPLGETVKKGLMIGFLGGFTTFSAFSLSVFQMLEQSQILAGLAYLIASPILCVAATFLGVILGRNL